MVYVLPSSLINKTLTRFTDQLVLNSHHNSLPHAVHRCSCRPQFVLKTALHAKGADAPDSLWNMAEAS